LTAVKQELHSESLQSSCLCAAAPVVPGSTRSHAVTPELHRHNESNTSWLPHLAQVTWTGLVTCQHPVQVDF